VIGMVSSPSKGLPALAGIGLQRRPDVVQQLAHLIEPGDNVEALTLLSEFLDGDQPRGDGDPLCSLGRHPGSTRALPAARPPALVVPGMVKTASADLLAFMWAWKRYWLLPLVVILAVLAWMAPMPAGPEIRVILMR
jgi:hypothetical protein